jgi:hypothetical protein
MKQPVDKKIMKIEENNGRKYLIEIRTEEMFSSR